MARPITPGAWRIPALWVVLLLALEGCVLAIVQLSDGFVHGVGHARRPIPEVVGWFGVASAVYLASVLLATRRGAPPAWFVVLGAVALRATMLLSSPIQEDDFYRYLWDGKVVASGVDPYGFSPHEIARFAAGERPDTGDPDADRDLERLLAIRDASPANRVILERVNHPGLRTIYPPAAQGVFALLGWLLPDRLDVDRQVLAVRVLMTLFDLGTLLLLVVLLGCTGLPRGLALAHGWCPLVIKEFANSAHVDAVPAFFLMLAVLTALRGRAAVTGLALAAAILAKYYALATLPFVLILLARSRLASGEPGPPARSAWAAPAVAFTTVAVAVGTTLLIGRATAGRLGEVTGHFLITWENHDAVFMWIRGTLAAIGSAFAGDADWANRAARWIVGVTFTAIVLAFTAHEIRRLRSDPPGAPDDRSDNRTESSERVPGSRGVLASVFSVLAALFILSPVGFPWYFAWCVPFLPFARRKSWYLMTGLVFVYYLRFWFDYTLPDGFASFDRGVDFHDRWLVSLEFGVFFLVWGYETVRGFRRS